jgi:hypothetical protein
MFFIKTHALVIARSQEEKKAIRLDPILISRKAPIRKEKKKGKRTPHYHDTQHFCSKF